MVGMRPTAKHAILLVTPMVKCFIMQVASAGVMLFGSATMDCHASGNADNINSSATCTNSGR
jgi:hypothetical protein